MNKKIIEAQRRRKGAPPTGRAEAPQRETGGGQGGGGGVPPGGGFQPSGGGFQGPSGGGFSSRGKQVGGCGSILVFLVIIAIYIFSQLLSTFRWRSLMTERFPLSKLFSLYMINPDKAAIDKPLADLKTALNGTDVAAIKSAHEALSAALQVLVFPLPNWYLLCWVALAPLLEN